jgi:integrase/recombinase XerD
MKGDYLTSSEWDKLLSKLPEPHKTVMQFCRLTACRIGTALGLMVSDVYDAEGKPKKRIYFPDAIVKGQNRGYSIDVSDKLRDVLIIYENPPHGFLFPSPYKADRHLSSRSVQLALKGIKKKVGLNHKNITTHSARISTLTDLAKKGIRWEVIRKISNHRNIQTLVNHYLIVSEDETKDAVNLI